ncbi:MAG: hypothetical protein LUH42_05085, partial [Oscillospiraceae bacterium]|nr:hypothetical protein [Oscillospiraceae bacterium]
MGAKRWPRRAAMGQRSFFRSARRTLLVLLAGFVIVVIVIGSLIFRNLVTELSVTAANDAVVAAINAIVKEVMADDSFDADSLVVLERDSSGGVTAVTANVAAINTLAAEVLTRAEEQTSQDVITVSIPLGNLAG